MSVHIDIPCINLPHQLMPTLWVACFNQSIRNLSNVPQTSAYRVLKISLIISELSWKSILSVELGFDTLHVVLQSMVDYPPYRLHQSVLGNQRLFRRGRCNSRPISTCDIGLLPPSILSLSQSYNYFSDTGVMAWSCAMLNGDASVFQVGRRLRWAFYKLCKVK